MGDLPIISSGISECASVHIVAGGARASEYSTGKERLLVSICQSKAPGVRQDESQDSSVSASGTSGSDASGFVVSRLGIADAQAIQHVLAEAFRSDPLGVAIFRNLEPGSDHAYRLFTRSWAAGVLAKNDDLFGVHVNGQLVGVVGVSWPERKLQSKPGLPGLRETVRALPGIRLLRVLLIALALRRPKQVAPNACELSMLAVHPAYQGQGIARGLMAAAHAVVANSKDHTQIYLYTTTRPNLRFYEHHGYQLVEAKKGGGVEIFHMCRPC